MADSALPRPPEVLEGFRVGPLRRSAGALAVHAATDRLDLPVEMHLVRVDALPADFPPERFTATLRAAAEVRHESLLPYVTGGRSGDLLFAASKAVDAASLDEVLSRGGALAEDRVLAIGAAVAGVLAALERAGLRHGDLTARRVLLPGRGQVAVGPPRLLPDSVAPRNERYLAPEEARGGAGDVRSDLYVLGLLLAEAATGGAVLRGASADVKRRIAAGEVRPDLPSFGPAARAVVSTLLAPDPAARYATAAMAESALLRAATRQGDAAAVPVAAPVASAATLVPLDDLPPETAPIPKGLTAAAVLAAAGAAAAPSTGAGAPAASPAGGDASAVRRSPGRLYVQGRLGETLLEIDETVHVGWPEGAIDVAARAEPFPEAEISIERTEPGDVLTARSGTVQVGGKPVRTCTLQHGDVVEGAKVRARYERTTRAALKATGYTGGPAPDRTPARIVLAAALVVALAGIALSLPRFTRARRDADEVEARAVQAEKALAAARPADGAGSGAGAAGAPSGASGGPTSPAASREQAARDAYEAAKDWARKNPGDAAGARRRLLEVSERYPESGHAAVARMEVAETDRRSRGGGVGEVGALLESSAKAAREGRLDEALKSLRDFVETHPGTVAAERASAAALRLESEVTARFETDVARVERALAEKDWDNALRLVRLMMDYVPMSLRDRAQELRLRAEAGRDGVDLPPKDPAGTKPPEGTGPTPEPPTTTPPGGPGGAGGGGTATPPTGDRDKDADAAFRAAKKLMDSGKDEEAIDALLAFLRDHKDTKPWQRYQTEARNRITSLSQNPAGVVKLFRGKVEKLDKERYRIRYDFSDAAQLADFRDVEAFEAPPRAAWSCEDGRVRTKGSGALVLDARFRIEQLVATATVNPDRAHDLGLTFVDASEPRRFYLFTLQNTFFTLGKGDAAKPFEENAIVLFGPGMWRDTPPGQLGFVRKAGSPEPAVRPGESLLVKAGKADAQVWMRFEGGKGFSGSAYGDVKLDFQGIEPGMFVLNSGGLFDDFVVEGTLDRDWVDERWRAILSGL